MVAYVGCLSKSNPCYPVQKPLDGYLAALSSALEDVNSMAIDISNLGLQFKEGVDR